MDTLDLKPLSKETIHKMGYTPHDLWVVKIKDEVYGPFEAESLRHYAHENEKMFHEAMASRLDHGDWQPFYSHAVFTRKNASSEASHPEEIGPYWILNNGVKVGPLSKMDIEKKIEMEILIATDHISYDDGHTWYKISQIQALHPKSLTAADLPQSPPLESSFQESRAELLEKIESKGPLDNPSLGLASLAYLGMSENKDKALTLNLDDIDLKSIHETEVSRSLRWAAPIAAVALSFLIVLTFFIFRPNSSLGDLAHLDDVSPGKKNALGQRPSENSRSQTMQRSPASVQPFQQEYRPQRAPTPVLHDSQYPTHVETHQDQDRFPAHDPGPEPEIHHEPPAEPEPASPESPEHSLVNNTPVQVPEPNESLDQAMNTVTEEAPPQQVVEEVSDF